MKIPVKLRPEQGDCLRNMQWVIERILSDDRETQMTDTRSLAQLKARCEEFLAFHLVQALNSEGL